MSDPLKTNEIEDVLSSIRKLVSTDGDAAAATDKLVLTPSLKVSNDEAQEPAQEEAPEPEAPEADTTEPEVSDDTGDVAEDQPLDAPDEATDEQGDESSTAEDTSEDEAAPGTDAEPLDLSAHVAEIETLVADSPDQFEPDGADPDAQDDSPADSIPWEDTESVTIPPASDPEEQSDPAAASYGNAFARSESLLEDGHEEIIDEEALRDLVAEIVRQELQGSLGERITRNVRKLVRREIARALAAKDLG